MEDLRSYNPEGSTLRKAQWRMLEIAIEFDKICKKNDITYWLMSGTLLGARRHGGFIPWDDDFDVGVRKEDCKKLFECLERELPDNFKLQTRETDLNYKYHYAKIRDCKSNIWEEVSSFRGYKYNGLFIDIFPFESICLTKKMKLGLDSRYNRLKYEFKKGFLWKIFAYFLYLASSFVVFILRILGKFTNDQYSHIYGIDFYAPHKSSTCFPVNKIKFEGYEFNAPNDVDQYLTNEYGNFMIVPPVDKRVFHSSKIEVFD